MAIVLVTGGAGYIGSHTCSRIKKAGHTPVVFDNLCNGHREFVRWGPFEFGDIRDPKRLNEVFALYRPDAVIHFAALIEVGQSIRTPLEFYDNNVAGTITLLNAAVEWNCRRIVFSSTCATYGDPCSNPIEESHPQAPINPYGRSKLMIERILADLSIRGEMSVAVLRYFNAAGAAIEEGIGEWHDPETHAVPLAVATALGLRKSFTLFGDTYETLDGSCIRDYVHVKDLAEAHLLALERLLKDGSSLEVNLGSGTGTSVMQLLSAVERVSGRSIAVEKHPPREGDAPALVADASKAAELLDWRTSHDLSSIVSSAWEWHSHHGFYSRDRDKI